MKIESLCKKKLLSTLREIIKGQSISTQTELAYALSTRGYKSIHQAKISRMLNKLGASRVRDSNNKMIYVLPDENELPKNKQTINTMVLSVDNNGMLIVIKTTLGGAFVISRILKTIGNSLGILGCIADDNTVLVIPSNHERIEEIIQSINDYLDINIFNS
jgi:transcriptional regulator of arginine metabolism